MLEASIPVLRYNLSYQRALGVAVLITTLSGNCNFNIRCLYNILSEGIENEKIKFIFSNGRPISFCIKDRISYSIDHLSKYSKIFSGLGLRFEHDFYRALGNFLELLAFSELHHKYHSADYFIKSVIPPINHCFYYIFYNEKEHPYAAVSWARLSNRKIKELGSDFINLEYEDWWSGERLFVYDLVAPWGSTTRICKHLAREVFTLDTIALADRRKSNNKRKAKFSSENMNKNLVSKKISSLKSALDSNKIEKIETSFFCLLNLIRQYELRVMLDSKNGEIFDSLKEIKARTNTLLYQARKRISWLNTEKNYFNYPVDIVVDRSYALGSQLNELNLCDFNFKMKPASVIDIMNFVWEKILLCFNGDDIKDRIFFDLRNSEDKIKNSFCKFMGRKMPTYISTAYDCSLKSALALAHEYTHAINFELTSTKNEYSIECRPVVLELIAILGEMFFVEHLIDMEIIPNLNVLEVVESNGCYIKGNSMELSNCKFEQDVITSYDLIYPISFVFASDIYRVYTSDRTAAYSLINKFMFDEGFNFDDLKSVCSNPNLII
ncbi:toxin-activating lysine-acyltransferase [Vibrio cholerae]